MASDYDKDTALSHQIINYLFASYQGRYAFDKVAEQLKGAAFSGERLKETGALLSRIHEWREELLKGMSLFAASWTKPETFDAQRALGLLRYLGPDINSIANVADEVLAQPQLTYDDAVFLAAFLARHAFSRFHFAEGNLKYAEAYRKPELFGQFSPLQKEGQANIAFAQKVAHMVEAAAPAYEDKRVELEAVLRPYAKHLPSVCRTQLHDIGQILARYLGGLTYAFIGISDEDALLWQKNRIDPVEAGYWWAYRVGPDEAAGWRAMRIEFPVAALVWKEIGFTVAEAADWHGLGILPPAAKLWRDAGYSSDQAATFMARGFDTPEKVVAGTSGNSGAEGGEPPPEGAGSA